MTGADELLRIRGLRISARTGAGTRRIVSGLDLDVGAGETVGIVGESGSGKSLAMRAVNALLPRGVVAEGSVVFRGRELLDLPERQVRRLRGRSIGMVLQDPFTMLSPLRRVRHHVGELLRDANGKRPGRAAVRSEVARRLAEVGIRDPDVMDRYPYELSGGMRQRVGIAAALALDPELLIADEPSTALDVTTQHEILTLLRNIQRTRGMGLVLITHDLRVAFDVCDRVTVLYAGEVLETAPAREMRREPLHPYTLGLLMSEPSADHAVERLEVLPGRIPEDRTVEGCVFAPRCTWALPECTERTVELRAVEQARTSACIRMEAVRGDLTAVRDRARSPRVAGADRAAQPPLVRTVAISKTFRRRTGEVPALREASITVGAGESVGIVGESGSGKTTLTRCLLGLETPTSGALEVDGERVDWRALPAERRARLRRDIQVVFQDPYSSLNPARTIGSVLREAVAAGGRRPSADHLTELLDRVGLPASYADRKPVGLSGGERQRVAIARALAVRPRLIVCDEPVSALDVSVQAQVLNLFDDLRRDLGVAYLFITHDLSVVRQATDRVYVMHAGEIVEGGSTAQILDRPAHAYTRSLLASVPGRATPVPAEPGGGRNQS
jgi:peptide/nickel transport system ATP-binding protein